MSLQWEHDVVGFMNLFMMYNCLGTNPLWHVNKTHPVFEGVIIEKICTAYMKFVVILKW